MVHEQPVSKILEGSAEKVAYPTLVTTLDPSDFIRMIYLMSNSSTIGQKMNQPHVSK